MLSVDGCKPSAIEESSMQERNRPYFFWDVNWADFDNQIIVGGMQDTIRILTPQLEFSLNFPYLGTITKNKFHPSKNMVAISVQDGLSQSCILHLDTRKIITLDSVSQEGARAIGWNNSGSILAVGDYEGNLTFYNEEGIFIKKVNTQQKSIIGLDWHPYKNLLVGVGEKIILYDYDLESLASIEDRKEEVLMLCVAWHPEGAFFATGDYGDFEYHHPPLLQYWDGDGRLLESIEKSKAEYRNLKWSSDGKHLATASEKLRLWNTDGELIKEVNSNSLLWGIDWNSTNDTLVTTDENGRITLRDLDLKILKEI